MAVHRRSIKVEVAGGLYIGEKDVGSNVDRREIVWRIE